MDFSSTAHGHFHLSFCPTVYISRRTSLTIPVCHTHNKTDDTANPHATRSVQFSFAKMTSTLQNIASSLPSLGRARLLINSADDVVIVSAVRTPVTKVRLAFRSLCPATKHKAGLARPQPRASPPPIEVL